MTLHIIDSTDGKHLGDIVDISGNVVTFADGEMMAVDERIEDPDGSIVLHNSNYTIRVRDIA